MPNKVSVVVPVYNPGEGIKKCIRSLRAQTLKDIEIIIIDDCGNDNAMTYVNIAAKHDDRIKIFKNPCNIGSGQSRNKGIEMSTGEYLSFIDPDDYIYPDFLELLYKKAKETRADIVKGSLRNSRLKNGTEKVGSTSAQNLRIRKGLEKGKPLYSLFFYEHTTAIYRRAFLLENSVFYGTSCNGEDLVFQLRACYGRRNIQFEDRAVYVYVERDGSNNRITSVARLNGEIQSVHEMLEFMAQQNEYTSESRDYLSRFAVKALQVHKVISRNEELRKEASEILNNFRKMLLNSPFLEELKEASLIIGAFVDYNINLAALPYSKYWYQGAYNEYKDQIEMWVDFLCRHPQYKSGCQPTLWQVFEAAIVYDNWDKESGLDRKKELREVRRQAHRLPDRRVLTDNYLSMKVFIDFGINTFSLRESKLGSIIKRIAVLAR